eukprot:117259-Pleurochrysis_carterae.AAC.1
MQSFQFCTCIACVLAEHSRSVLGLPCHRARMADLALPRPASKPPRRLAQPSLPRRSPDH